MAKYTRVLPHARKTSLLAAAALLVVPLLLMVGGETAGASTANTIVQDPDQYSCSQRGYIDFEQFPDGTNLSSTTFTGVQFTTTGGYTWQVGDFATGAYNGKYPNGAYTSQGTHWAWLGTAQGAGRIDLIEGAAAHFSVLVSATTSVVLEAYAADGTLLETAGPSTAGTGNGEMDELRVDRPTAEIDHLLIHDSGNYFLVDGVCTDAPGVPSNQGHGVVVSFGDSIAAGEGSGPHTGYPNNDNAYSARLASKLGWSSYNFAISGACAATSGKGGVWGTPSECTKSVITDEIPVAAAMNLTPNLVTVTVGANDIRFGDCIQQVLGFASSSPCTGKPFADHLQALKLNLGMALAKIRDLYGSNVPIAVTRYFSPMPGHVTDTKDVCTAMPPLALAKIYKDKGAREAVWAVRDLDNRAFDYQNSVADRTYAIVGKLNSTLNTTAMPYGVTMITLDFSAHDFCTDYDGHADAWVLAPQVNVFASYYGAGGLTFQRELKPAHRCVTTPSCDTTTLFVDKSGDWLRQHWTFILNFWSNDFPHLTKPGHDAVASRIIKTLGLK
ncbi:GDSL-type esterase/lipase family protein [Jatrophihabitans sp.]|uniref:GDSL-type esterase/lipase family protein n=1 Tax=Jatrophihabitans sp. TaxID=1932789 RepID=UPI002F0D5A81